MAMPGNELWNPLLAYMGATGFKPSQVGKYNSPVQKINKPLNAVQKPEVQGLEPQKTPFLQQKAAFGMDRGTLLSMGLGMLSGRNFQDGIANSLAYMSHGMQAQEERRKEAEQKARMDKFKSGLTPEQAMLFDIAPDAVAGGMAEQMFASNAPEGFTLSPGETRFSGTGKQIATVADDDDGSDWVKTTISKNGVPTVVEYDRNAQDPQATMREIGPEYVKPDPDAGRPDATGEGQLRREFNSLTSDFRAVHESYNRITATDTSTPAGQMGLIFQYMKMLDPGSTVREGEYATAQNTTGVPGQVMNAYNRALEGKFLTGDQITDFETQAKNLYNRASSIYGQKVNDYRRLAGEYEFSPERTVVDVRGFFGGQSGVGGPDSPPPGVDPEDWKHLTPEEKAMWGAG